MNSSSAEVFENKEMESEKDNDPKPVIPLRQRRLPASFWQEPSIVPITTNQENHQTSLQSPSQPLTANSLHPWAMNIAAATLPAFLPQRLSLPNSLALVQHPSPLWIRSPANYCNCAMCLNYAYLLPRFPDMYCGLRVRPAMNIYCTGSNCADQSCKLCTATGNWHPERIRQSRLRSARYNALMD